MNELSDTKEKLRSMTTKFQSTRKERDHLKQENKELQTEIITLQTQMRQMVPCTNNTSQSFPMYNELTQKVSELFKCESQDVFFDLLSPELNLDGVVFFYANVYTPIFKTIQKHFEPVEQAIARLTHSQLVDGPLESVLKKTYQTKWREMFKDCLGF